MLLKTHSSELKKVTRPPFLHPKTSILVLDDDSVMLEFSKRLLENSGVKNVVTTECPTQCVALSTNQHFDLILIDYVLMDKTGADVAAEIRSNGNTASRIVGLTGNLRGDVSEHCLASGMDGVLEKPLRLRELSPVFLKASQEERRVSAPS